MDDPTLAPSTPVPASQPSPPVRHLALRLSLLAALVNCQPSEPFLTEYLLNVKGFTQEELATNVWPWATFGSFLFLLPFGLLAELVSARHVIMLGLLCREATRVLLIWGQSIQEMQLVELAYAGGVAAQAIYFAYIYAAAPPEQHARLTSLVHAAYHAGNVVGALGAEALVNGSVDSSWRGAGLTKLFYLSWAFTTCGLVAFAALPPPRHDLPDSLAARLARDGRSAACRSACSLWETLTARRWLLWYALAGGGAAVVGNYFQLLLANTGAAHIAYGLLEAGVEAGAVVGALAAMRLEGCVRRHPVAFLAASSLLRGGALALAALVATPGAGTATPFALNIFAATVYGLQQAAGCAQLAASARGLGQYALLFSANSLVANGAACVLGWAGALAGWNASRFFYAAAAAMGLLAAAAPLVRGQSWDGEQTLVRSAAWEG